MSSSFFFRRAAVLAAEDDGRPRFNVGLSRQRRTGAFSISVLAHKRKTQLKSSAEGGSFLLQFESAGKSDRKLAQGGLPVPNRHRPFFGYVGKGKVKYLQYRRVIGKRSLGLDDLTKRTIERFYRIGGIDHLEALEGLVREKQVVGSDG